MARGPGAAGRRAVRRPRRVIAVLIAPGAPHKLFNPGADPLVVLCCSAPPYADADTELLE